MRKRKVYSVKDTMLFFRRKMYALVTLSLGIFLFVSCAKSKEEIISDAFGRWRGAGYLGY
jgi:hypothetical protein